MKKNYLFIVLISCLAIIFSFIVSSGTVFSQTATSTSDKNPQRFKRIKSSVNRLENKIEETTNPDIVNEEKKRAPGFYIEEMSDGSEEIPSSTTIQPATSNSSNLTTQTTANINTTSHHLRKEKFSYINQTILYMGVKSRAEALQRVFDTIAALEECVQYIKRHSIKNFKTTIVNVDGRTFITYKNIKIIEVTKNDALINNQNKKTLAFIWRDGIDSAIKQHIKNSKTETLDQLVIEWAIVILFFFGLMLIAEILRILINKYSKNLINKLIDVFDAIGKYLTKKESIVLTEEEHKEIDEKITFISDKSSHIFDVIVRIVQILVFFLFILLILYQVPQTNHIIRGFAHAILSFIVLALSDFIDFLLSNNTWRAFANSAIFMMAVFVTIYIIKVIESIILSFIHVTTNDIKGKGKRFQTITKIISATLQIIIVFISVFILLEILQINMTPLLAGAGIAGLSLSFGAQNLLKDIINGVFILFEDQFGIGDFIKIDQLTGVVEDMTLRITVLRDMTGAVHIIPNSQITKVSVYTKQWARAVVTIPVPYNNDADETITIIEQTAEEIFHEFPEQILSRPNVLGIDSMTRTAFHIKLAIDTVAGEQWAIERELRRRIKMALDNKSRMIIEEQISGEADQVSL